MTEVKTSVTNEVYGAFQQAYDFFNARMWGGELADCLVTLQRKRGARGYFFAQAFVNREDKSAMDELAMNPDTYGNRSDKDVLSTLAHEMAHKWQQQLGNPSRNGYHNTEWANEMLRIGLQPMSQSTGKKGTGQKVSHEIIEDGLFDQLADELLATGFNLGWQGRGADDKPEKKHERSKVKYTCETCEAAVWGKPELNIVCGDCGVAMPSDE